ncbi:MAG: DNA-processing protein DprA [Phycisphaeraceae bacterium]|nr:DNA-processing protein DprA [Phycisphaeraceae bacterium]
MPIDAHTFGMLRLSLTPGLGPVLVARAVRTLGSIEDVLSAGETALRRVKGIGQEKARSIAAGLAESAALAEREATNCEQRGIGLIAHGSDGYPALLAEVPAPPLVLYVRGSLAAISADRYAVAIVGSRECSAYGLEQSARFATALAQAGLTIVSGGARGIDTAAHTAAFRLASTGGRTVVVTGCGLGHVYPPENARLFDQIVDSGAGCVVSELPLAVPPSSENFPARNRIISGLSLGVVVIEAARRSGALITARQAVEEHNREVFAVPGRVDSAFSAGSLDLIKSGGAALVTHPDDVLSALESPARHQHAGTHEARYGHSATDDGGDAGSLDDRNGETPLFGDADKQGSPPRRSVRSRAAGDVESSPLRDAGLSDRQREILRILGGEPRSMDDLIKALSAEASSLRAEITVLEIRRRVRRVGSKLAVVE